MSRLNGEALYFLVNDENDSSQGFLIKCGITDSDGSLALSEIGELFRRVDNPSIREAMLISSHGSEVEVRRLVNQSGWVDNPNNGVARHRPDAKFEGLGPHNVRSRPLKDVQRMPRNGVQRGFLLRPLDQLTLTLSSKQHRSAQL